MELETLKVVAQLGGTVAVVFAFLWYLRDRNGKLEKTLNKMAESMAHTTDAVNKNTKVLIKVAQKHKLIKEVDELIS